MGRGLGRGSGVCGSYPTDAHTLALSGVSPSEAFDRISGLVAQDGDPAMNLGTFVTTAMEPEAEELMRVGARINIIDQGEYPASVDIHDRCLSIIADLWHAPLRGGAKPTGTATVGSSEACMLAGLAMKWRWRDACKREGRPAGNPNLVVGANYQICWGKFCRYFDVEMRAVPCCPDTMLLTPELARAHVDENTIGVVAILGSTFNGGFEDVAGMDRMLQELQDEKGWDVPVHVDAASGGFIAPFTQPDLAWDFVVPRVRSINASGHKYGMACAGVGWLLFKAQSDLPRDLVFTHSYLAGGEQESLTLNFSKAASPILAQYYQLLRLGHDGFSAVMHGAAEVASQLRRALVDLGNVETLDVGDMPLVAFRLRDDSLYSVYELAEALLAKGWKVPAYPPPAGCSGGDMMRVVVRPSMTSEMAATLAADFGWAMDTLLEQKGGCGGSVEAG
eukprot:TRINITY_DN2077_c4_g1_i1.p2 TRINITY_DN2077_c4_g1~~TRINITY_DN2077_c4_g1_i1.p2  ORF type:complete len:449 (+),score=196.74 TRINITY_DN2077_c4_g1_i1:65-1411(+)